ncbi:hypothetical protein HKX48_003263 [Thoreauomyces humboldtii]|nr:hypothetical protein HKX48_003263 [Thoreauomyces humboldtii]
MSEAEAAAGVGAGSPGNLVSSASLPSYTTIDPERAIPNEGPATEETPLLGTGAVANPAAVVSAASKPPRLLYLDHIRGLLMVFQSIDHARGILSRIVIHHEEWWNMPDFEGSLYHWFIRFLTALCAPGFFMTMGMSVVLFTMSRYRVGWRWFAIIKHFFIRGSVLIAFNFIMLAGSGMGVLTTVLFALGVNIFVGSLIVGVEALSSEKLTVLITRYRPDAAQPARIAVTISIVAYVVSAVIIACLASWYTPSSSHQAENVNWLFRIVFLPHQIDPADNVKLYSMYAPVPWLPMVLWGIALQRTVSCYKLRPMESGVLHAALATVLWIVFIPMRLSLGFGNINPEDQHPSPRHSFINFFNLTKYPPSVTYITCTLGIVHALCALFILGELKLKQSAWTSDRNPLIVFGRSSFFFYMVHFYVYRFFSYVFSWMGWMHGAGGFGGDQSGNLPDAGFWSAWVFGLVLMYFMCERYGRFKAGTAPESIWRFF